VHLRSPVVRHGTGNEGFDHRRQILGIPRPRRLLRAAASGESLPFLFGKLKVASAASPFRVNPQLPPTGTDNSTSSLCKTLFLAVSRPPLYQLPNNASARRWCAAPAATTGPGAGTPVPVVMLEGHTRWIIALQPLPGGRLASGSGRSADRRCACGACLPSNALPRRFIQLAV